jgi:lipopolysaccharide export system permease protein
MALVLMIIAVPLAKLRPRQGRFGKIGLAVLAYFIYYYLLIAARSWIETNSISALVGLWWVHVVGLALAFVLLRPDALRWQRPRLAAGAA